MLCTKFKQQFILVWERNLGNKIQEWKHSTEGKCLPEVYLGFVKCGTYLSRIWRCVHGVILHGEMCGMSEVWECVEIIMSSTSFMKCVPCSEVCVVLSVLYSMLRILPLFRGMCGIVCPLFHVTYSFLVQRYAWYYLSFIPCYSSLVQRYVWYCLSFIPCYVFFPCSEVCVVLSVLYSMLRILPLFRGMRGIICPLFHVILPLFRGMRGIVQGLIQEGWEAGY